MRRLLAASVTKLGVGGSGSSTCKLEVSPDSMNEDAIVDVGGLKWFDECLLNSADPMDGGGGL